MKRWISILILLVFALFLTACGAQSGGQTAAPTNTPAQESSATVSGSSEKKMLIVYFAPSNSDTVDAVSSATPRTNGIASTQYVAELIRAQTGADIAPIVPAEAYPLPYKDAADYAKQEQNDDARPAFTQDANPEDYDVIVIGYPIWWYHLPMILRTFFDTYDFTGKTIVPFNTHAGSRDGGTYREIAELEPGATVTEGLAVSGDKARGAESAVRDWLSGLGY